MCIIHAWVQISSTSKLTISTYLLKHYGINHNKLQNLLIAIGLESKTKYKSVTKEKLHKLNKILQYYKLQSLIEQPLKNKIYSNIAVKIKLNTLQGKRHRLKYPVKGQRTRSNARTAKKLNRNIGSP